MKAIIQEVKRINKFIRDCKEIESTSESLKDQNIRLTKFKNTAKELNKTSVSKTLKPISLSDVNL